MLHVSSLKLLAIRYEVKKESKFQEVCIGCGLIKQNQFIHHLTGIFSSLCHLLCSWLLSSGCQYLQQVTCIISATKHVLFMACLTVTYNSSGFYKTSKNIF